MAVASQRATGTRQAPDFHRFPLTRDGASPRVAPRWLEPLWVLVADLVALAGALALAGGASVLAIAYVPLALLSLAVAGGYRRRMSLQALDLAPWLVTRLAVPLLLLAPLGLLTDDVEPLLETVLVSVVLLVAARVLAFTLLRDVRRRGHLLDPTVILGAGEVGAQLARTFLDHPECGVVPVGFLDCVDGDLPAPLLGDVDQLDRLLESYDIRRVIVAFGPAQESELVGVLRAAVTHDVDVSVVPRFFDNGIASSGPDTDEVRGIPLYRVRQSALRTPAWLLKRAVDIVLAGTVLVLAAPLLAVCAIAVKVQSPGPVLFRQRRIGQGGRMIEVPKLRSLEVNHDSDTQWAVDHDPRVTPIGRFMRRTCIDELPQLWSVLKGDMSLVGPRPERPLFVKRFSSDVWGYGDRHRVPVGLTGWAQVNGLRGDTSIEERARFDNQYIEHWSLWRDIVVLIRTVAEVARGSKR